MTDCMVKLCSGEELFASIDNIEGEMITFTDPMKIYKRYVETNNGMTIELNFEPFIDYSGVTKHIIGRQHIMACEPLIPRLVALYTEMKTTTKSSVSDSPVVPGNITIH